MKISVIACTFLALFLDYALQAKVPPPKEDANNGDDGEWPFEAFLTGGKITVHPTYGSASTQMRRDKSDGKKKMNAIVELTRAIPCTASVTMNTKVKNAGVWVNGFHNGPKPLDVYIKSISDYVDMFFHYINTTYSCPFGPGTFALENFVVDSRKFPKDTALGEYILTHYFTVLSVEALVIEFKASLEKP
ncbi:uncharacterized protein [Anabrus simplex]|uniref:uncharacterized protein n=1 Tax=Anabrus simplex TaxID=316456 RepID=UPI0035A34DEE